MSIEQPNLFSSNGPTRLFYGRISMQIGLKRLRAFLIVPRILHFFLFMGCLLNFDRHFWFLICFQAEMFMLNPLLNFRLTVDECHCSRLLSLPGSGLVTNRGIGQFIVSRGDWLGKPANIKVENSGAVVYVRSSLSVHNPLFFKFVHRLWLNESMRCLCWSIRSKW